MSSGVDTQITPRSPHGGLEGQPESVMADQGAKRGSEKRSPPEMPASKRGAAAVSGKKKTEWVRAQFLFLHPFKAPGEGEGQTSAADPAPYVGEADGTAAEGDVCGA